ncbi:MAG: Gfo/Idh/MocA family oxidoreductase [Chloroflexi bacterium]|nr:Gfo/Idh/MocA family oxidoreductase [Chloroflexota bacterium]
MSIKAAVVGAGLMGRWHADAIRRSGGKLVAVADTVTARAERLARVHRARPYDSLEALLAQTDAAVVHICTSLDAHVPLAMSALQAGKHVVVEKPLTPDAPSTERLLALAQSRRRLIQPVHQFVFQRGVQRALAECAHIAPLVHVQFSAITAGGSDSTDAQRDALVADILPHALALFAGVLPVSLDHLEWHVLRPCAGELRAWAEVTGVAFSILISTRGRPTQNVLTLIGARGTIHADLYHGFALREGDKVSRAQKMLHPFAYAAHTLGAASANLIARALQREPAYPGLRAFIAACYCSIETSSTPPFAADEIIAVARARDQIITRAQA